MYNRVYWQTVFLLRFLLAFLLYIREKLREKQFSAPSLGEYWHESFLLYHSLIFEVGLRFAAAVQQGGQRPVPT